MGTKWKKSKAVLGFAAFVLGVSLLLEGALYFGVIFTSSNSRRWAADSLQADWRDTQEFRSFIGSRLEQLITMGAGGKTYSGWNDGYYYYDFFSESPSYSEKKGQAWAKYVHETWKEDKNILYSVRKDGTILYSNSDALLTANPPEGYGFLLQFDGQKVRIWKDGQELDVYGGGYYSFEGENTEQWYVPGYKNFTVDEAGSQVNVTMAVIDEPQIFIKGNYGKTGSDQYNQLYYTKRGVAEQRERIIAQAVRAGAGAGLLLVYILLRKDKKRVDTALAQGTGRIWFEVKVLTALLLLFFCMPHTEYLGELVDHTPNLLAGFWGLYLLVFNDWRYNKRPWKRGVIAMLAAWGLNLPLQKRLSRVCGFTALTLLILGAVNLNLLVYCTSFGGRLPLEAVWVFATPAALLLVVCTAFLWRMRRLWTDLGAVAEQAAAVRAGQLESELALQEHSDLYQMASDLNHIRQGLHQAVEERTHSERMKVELVTNVSHDLKTPLTSIISYTELLAQEPLVPPASEYVQIMGEKAQRLKAMVQDVFEVSKAASGQLPVKLERLDYARLLRQTLADMAQAIEESGLTLRPSIPEEEIPILADSDRLYRVFQNLIGNALKYSLSGSRVYLSLVLEEGQATASVRNTSAAELKPGTEYTARFVRGDESRTDGGSGLGLSIAESFTRACGGMLTITTEADLFTASVTFSTAV